MRTSSFPKQDRPCLDSERPGPDKPEGDRLTLIELHPSYPPCLDSIFRICLHSFFWLSRSGFAGVDF